MHQVNVHDGAVLVHACSSQSVVDVCAANPDVVGPQVDAVPLDVIVHSERCDAYSGFVHAQVALEVDALEGTEDVSLAAGTPLEGGEDARL